MTVVKSALTKITVLGISALLLVCMCPAFAHATTDAGYEAIKDQLLPTYNHGSIEVEAQFDSDGGYAVGNDVYLGSDKTVYFYVTPYKHVQYTGCRMWNKPCPVICDEMFQLYPSMGSLGSTCFQKGYGCICNKNLTLESANIAVSINDPVFHAGYPIIRGPLEVNPVTTSDGVGATSDGVVEIVYDGDDSAAFEVTIAVTGLYFWPDVTQTFTVHVS